MRRNEALSAEVLGPIRTLFFQECEELLGDVEAGLLALERSDCDLETLNSVFRAIHSIKGSAGAFDLPILVEFAHQFESVLAAIQAGRLAPDSALVKLLLRAADVIADMVRLSRDDQTLDERQGAEVAAALAQTLAPLGDKPRKKAADTPAEEPIETADDGAFPDFDFQPLPVAIDLEDEAPPAAQRRWRLSLRPDSALYANGGELLPLFRELQRLGELSVALVDPGLPLLGELHPEKAYLGWVISLATTASEQDIRDIFAFVEADCALELVEILDEPAAPHTEPAPAEAEGKSASAAPGANAVAPPAETIRVDLERLDRVVNLVGELLITQAMLTMRLRNLGVFTDEQGELPTEEMNRLARTLQDGVMAMRAQPVKVVFQRMPRLVRELEAATGKQVDLHISGEATEVDRTVIERLTDPLTHMVRNAVDHGIETPERRLAAGKPARGSLKLTASHRNGRVLIEIADDGAGIDRERVRAKAVERSLIGADAVLSPQEIDDLIFAPGFSTAASVTDLSGRGVGMDVVKRGVEALGGRISFVSAPGAGSSFMLSLPLTLAVVDGMGTRVCGNRVVVPLSSLIEVVKPGPDDIRRLGRDVSLLRFRGRHLPIIDLGARLGYRSKPLDPAEQIILVVEDDRGFRAGLVADEIHGHRQIVIRSLETNYQAVEGISACSIAGDGGIVMILDVHAILTSLRREYALESLP